MDFLLSYDWPGNVRELENAIARGVIVTSAPLLLVEDLPSSLLSKIESEGNKEKDEIEDGVPLPQLIEKIEKGAIIKALEKAQGNKTKAAQILGISRKSLFNKLNDNYNIS